MTLKETQNLAKSIFRLLKVSEISFPIGRTNKGNLEIKFTTQKDDFDLILDSVPLPTASKINDENNITLKGLVEKYWFYTDITTFSSGPVGTYVNVPGAAIIGNTVKLPKNKGGRPKGSKNKTRTVEDKVNG